MKVYEVQNSFGLDSLQVSERPEPGPEAGQVLLRMKAWSLNYRDLLVVKGQYNPRLKLPLVPLSDAVGEVVAVGPGVSRVKAGERVAGAFMPGWVDGKLTDTKAKSALGGGGTGLLAEYVVLPADGVVPVPAHLSDEEAATLPCAAVTAWHALVTAGRLQAGDTVLIQGTGGVALFGLQFALLSGAGVIVTSSSDAKLARALDMGARHGINYKALPDWEKKVLELTAATGVDHVVEVGGAGTLPRSLKAVRPGGTISLIGILSGVGEVNPVPILMKGVRVQGIFVGSREMFQDMNRAITLHKMKPVVDRVFPFSEARQALQHMEKAAHFGKIVIKAPSA